MSEPKVPSRMKIARRLFKKAISKAAASEEAESYFVPYVEPLSVARTPLVAFFNSLLTKKG